MPFWGSVLGALAVALLGGLYLAGFFRKRRPKEPPLDKGLVPWLGHALHFRRDGEGFLRSMQKKHGDVFTALIAGQYFTFLLDPLSFGAVVKEARAKLDFVSFAAELVLRVFRFRSSADTHKMIEASSMKHLKGDGLAVMTQAMMEGLQTVLLHRGGSSDGRASWRQEGLFHFCYSAVFRAGYLALFGNEPARPQEPEDGARRRDLSRSAEVFAEFRKYDRLFPRLSYCLLTPPEWSQVRRLWRYFWRALAAKEVRQKDNVSGWVSEQGQRLAESGVPEHMRDRFMFLLLWAAQGNSGPASFWLLLYLLKNPPALQAVRKEVEEVARRSGQEPASQGQLLRVTKDMLGQTPALDSAVEETLRMASAPLLIRLVAEDLQLKLGGGRSYALRRGDKIGLFPNLSAHMDPDIHPEPRVFKYDRFLSENGSKKEFYKNGQKVKYCTMPWGAGVSMCPGRFFATNEIKLFVFLMLTCFDLELINQEEEVPPIDKARYGFGVMQPLRDVQFRYRYRY